MRKKTPSNTNRKCTHCETIICFNENGEWLCDLDGRRITLLSGPKFANVICIAIGCIKKPRLEILVEKATEIGVTEIQLLHTDYAQKIHYDMDRLHRISIEATEQCGRLVPLRIIQSITLKEYLDHTNGMGICVQDGGNLPNTVTTLLIGPEGGWSPCELEHMSEIPKITLGSTILRSETAAIVAGYLLNNRI